MGNTDALKAYMGARLACTIALSDGMTLTPELRGRFVYDVLGDDRNLTANLIDDATTTNWQATISYDAEILGGDVLHTARGGFTWAF